HEEVRSCSPQPSDIGALDTDISVWERCVSTSLLENGIEDHQPKASAGDVARAASQVNALRTWTTCSWCQLVAMGVSSPPQPTLRSKARFSGPKISMESLILAQDER